MEVEHRNAMAAVRMAGQTADTRRDRTAADLMGDRVAVAGIAVPARLTVDPVAVVVAGTVEAAVLPIADPAEVVVAVRAEAVRRAEEAVVRRMRPRHAVAAEGLTGKVVKASPSLALSPFGPGVVSSLFRK